MKQYTNLSINETLTKTLAASGCISALSYCFQMGAIKTAGPVLMAATNGHTQTLKYLQENECPWHEKASVLAAKNGHIEVLTYFREIGSPWDSFVPLYAKEI